MTKKSAFPTPAMVASGESSTPFRGSDVKEDYQPGNAVEPCCNTVPTDYGHWGAAGVGGMKPPVRGFGSV